MRPREQSSTEIGEVDRETAARGGWRGWRKLIIGDLSWRRLIRSVVLIYLILVVVGLFFSERLIFPYRGSSYDEGLSGLELIDGGDGQRLAVRYWKEDGARGVVVLFHGNMEDIGHLDWIAREIRAGGVSVIAMDYRGYGLSEGSATEKGCYADAERVYDLVLEKGYAPDQVLLWGRSVGGGTATELARRKRVKGIVLESSFVTAYRAATRVPILPFDKFKNLEKLKGLQVPLFVIHGTADEIVGYWHGERLFEAYRGEKRFFPMEGAGHNDLWAFDTEPMLASMREFFKFGGAPEKTWSE